MTTISPRRFLRSFRHALHGLGHAWQTENNFRIHVVAAAVVFAAAAYWRIPANQVILLVGIVAAMLVLELVNTIMERFADLLEPRVHPYVHVIKDLMAAAVAIAAVAAVIFAILIFGPHLR